MPTIPPPSSQGSTVTFNGVPIGRLTNWRLQPATARIEDVTNVGCRVVGTGINTRVVNQFECIGIVPGGVDISLRNVPPYIFDHTGLLAMLAVNFATGSLSMEAFLETFDVSGTVGEFLRGTARFRFSGVKA
jgi:hypothetical protein